MNFVYTLCITHISRHTWTGIKMTIKLITKILLLATPLGKTFTQIVQATFQIAFPSLRI